MEEIWKDIEGYEGLYQVSNLGRVKSLPKRVGKGNGYLTKEIILKQKISKNGYFVVCLRKNNKNNDESVHRLVAKAFIVNPKNLPQVGHKDETRTNNNADNLEWVTAKENCNMPLHRKIMSEKTSGERNPMYGNHSNLGKKHTEETKQKMRKNHADFSKNKHPRAIGVICDGVVYGCIKECADYYKISHGTLSQYLNGKKKMPNKWLEMGLRYNK